MSIDAPTVADRDAARGGRHLPFSHPKDEQFAGACPSGFAGYDLRAYQTPARQSWFGHCGSEVIGLNLPAVLRRASNQPSINGITFQVNANREGAAVGYRYAPGRDQGVLWRVVAPFADLLVDERRPGVPPASVFGMQDTAPYVLPQATQRVVAQLLSTQED